MQPSKAMKSIPSKDGRMENRILIHAPVGKDAVLAASVLRNAGLECFVCKDGPDIFRELNQGAGALFIVEEALLAGVLKPLSRYVANQPNWSDLPILVLANQGVNSPSLQSVIEMLGNFTLLERPVRTASLISTARSALRGRMRQYQMRETDRLKDEFLASLGHELRNPLAPIRTSMQVLNRRLPDVPEVSKVTHLVERQVAHLTRLVDDLLDVARVTSGKVTLQRKHVLLSDVIGHAFEICRPLFDAGKHSVDIEQPTDDLLLDADPARLVQSLCNVLANAVKFTLDPSTIYFRAYVAEGNLVLEVQDSGIGLETESLTRIFEMFTQNDPVRGQILGGLGIGLSLTKRFTEMHGGTIHAFSEGLGKGCVFVLTLPIVVKPEFRIENAASLNSSAPGTFGRLPVLIVDDNKDGADMLQMMLEMDGYTVVTAYNGQGAVEAASKTRPEVILMDIGLPDIDGYEAARRIRQQPGGQDIVLIALTGWGHEHARRLATEAGMNHHFVKPVDLALLKEHLVEIEKSKHSFSAAS